MFVWHIHDPEFGINVQEFVKMLEERCQFSKTACSFTGFCCALRVAYPRKCPYGLSIYSLAANKVSDRGPALGIVIMRRRATSCCVRRVRASMSQRCPVFQCNSCFRARVRQLTHLGKHSGTDRWHHRPLQQQRANNDDGDCERMRVMRCRG